jgi:hypothetical protein
LAKFSQELIGRYKERIVLKDAADDNHGMSSQDVNHRVTPKTTEMVQPILDGRKQDAILFLVVVEKRADVTRFAQL